MSTAMTSSTPRGVRADRGVAPADERCLSSWRLPALFTATIFLAAALLFCVQPIVAKLMLPALGGTPAVWTTCMLFFQATLLAGYAYAHLVSTRLAPRSQLALQAVIILLPFLVLPIGLPSRGPEPSQGPISWILWTLCLEVGLPFFAVATTSPLLQRWYALTGVKEARDPYFLYAASNAGCLLALLSYPVLIEPIVGLSRQTLSWALAYAALAAFILACGLAMLRSRVPARQEMRCDMHDVVTPIRWKEWAGWVARAALPSSWMLGVTSYLTMDLGAIPLLWLLPLTLYLLSFVAVFARVPWIGTRVSGPWMAGLVGVACWALTVGTPPGLGLIALHLGAFFAGSLLCHGWLAEHRPAAEHLTSFYLALSVGGVLGGLFNGVVAPSIFDRQVEYPLVLALSALALPAARIARPGVRTILRDVATALLVSGIAAVAISGARLFNQPRLGAIFTELGVATAMAMLVLGSRRRPLRLALGVGGILLAGLCPRGDEGRVLLRDRSFFGSLRVEDDSGERFRRLVHGVTIHGKERLDSEGHGEPLAYYHRSGPAGDLANWLTERTQSAQVGVVGLGAGSLAAYARPADRWFFYEIDPAIERVARNPDYFSYLPRCRAESLDVILGDARQKLAAGPMMRLDLLVLDAFSSDAIPVHLLTREAFALYRRALAPGGIVAFHISNRYVDLKPVLDGLAADAGWICRIREDLDVSPELLRDGKSASIWAVLAGRREDLGPIGSDPRWRVPPPCPSTELWTDDYSNIVRHLRFGR